MLNRFSVKGRMYLVILSIVFLFGLMMWFGVANSHNVRNLGLEKTRSVMLDDQKAKLKVATHSVALAVGHAIEGMDDKQRQIESIRKSVDDIRFEDDQSGYYFVYENTINVALPPAKAKQGNDLGGLKDKNGVYIDNIDQYVGALNTDLKFEKGVQDSGHSQSASRTLIDKSLTENGFWINLILSSNIPGMAMTLAV